MATAIRRWKTCAPAAETWTLVLIHLIITLKKENYHFFLQNSLPSESDYPPEPV